MTAAWIFAGHGSQYPGMGRPVLSDTKAGRDWLAAAEEASGLPLGRLAAQGPASTLADPRFLEPLLAAVSGTYVDLLRFGEGSPAAVAGYSAGHLAALYAAGVVDRTTCIEIACIRGERLARAAVQSPGGMVSVHGLPIEQLAALAADDPTDPASVAARNAPMHMVYSGSRPALSRAIARARLAGASVAPLDVAGPWHSALLKPCREEIAAAVAVLPLRPAQMPVWSTVTARATQDPEELRISISASVECTVEWHATVLAMSAAGIDEFVEVGAGRTLWGLLGQTTSARGFSRRYMESERGPARRRAVREIVLAAAADSKAVPIPAPADVTPLPAVAEPELGLTSSDVVIANQAASVQEPA